MFTNLPVADLHRKIYSESVLLNLDFEMFIHFFPLFIHMFSSPCSIYVLNFGFLIPEGEKLVWDDAKGHYVRVDRGTTHLKRRRSSGYSIMVLQNIFRKATFIEHY